MDKTLENRSLLSPESTLQPIFFSPTLFSRNKRPKTLSDLAAFSPFATQSQTSLRSNKSLLSSTYSTGVQELSSEFTNIYTFKAKCFEKIRNLEAVIERNKYTFQNEISYMQEYIYFLKRKLGTDTGNYDHRCELCLEQSRASISIVKENQDLRSALKDSDSQTQLYTDELYAKKYNISQSKSIDKKEDSKQILMLENYNKENEKKIKELVLENQDLHKKLKNQNLKNFTAFETWTSENPFQSLKSFQSNAEETIHSSESKFYEIFEKADSLNKKLLSLEETFESFKSSRKPNMKISLVDENRSEIIKTTMIRKENLELIEKCKKFAEKYSLSNEKIDILLEEIVELNDHANDVAEENRTLKETISQLNEKNELLTEKNKEMNAEVVLYNDFVHQLLNKKYFSRENKFPNESPRNSVDRFWLLNEQKEYKNNKGKNNKKAIQENLQTLIENFDKSEKEKLSLQETINKLNQKLKSFELIDNQVQETNQLKQSLSKIQKELNLSNENFIALKLENESHYKNIKNANETIKSNEEKINKLKRNETNFIKNIKNLNELVSQIENKNENLEETVKSLNQELQFLRDQDVSGKIEEKSNQIAQLLQDFEKTTSLNENIRNEIERLKNLLKDIRNIHEKVDVKGQKNTKNSEFSSTQNLPESKTENASTIKKYKLENEELKKIIKNMEVVLNDLQKQIHVLTTEKSQTSEVSIKENYESKQSEDLIRTKESSKKSINESPSEKYEFHLIAKESSKGKIKFLCDLVKELEYKNAELEERFNRIRNKNNILESNTKKYSENVEKLLKDINKKFALIEKLLASKEEKIESIFKEFKSFRKNYFVTFQQNIKGFVQELNETRHKLFDEEYETRLADPNLHKNEIICLCKEKLEFLQNKIVDFMNSNFKASQPVGEN